ncbi:MAG: gamma-glutamyltransferase [Acidimicrobiales bacterium]
MTVVQGPSGGVASGDPRAAESGLRVLADGGSSVDAALAMAVTQWVVNGPICGPGGDLFVLHVDDGTSRVYSGWSRVPFGFPPDGPVDSHGPRSAVVPGAMSGVDAAWKAAGRVPWRRLFEDAIALADGHEVTPWMATSYASVEAKGHLSALRAVLDTDQAPTVGERVSCRRLKATLGVLADDGADAFYRGSLAAAILSASRADGAYLRADDLDAMTGHAGPATTVALDDMTIAYPPPPSQSGITADMLAAAGAEMAAESRSFANATAPVAMDQLIARCIVGVPGTATSIATDGVSAAVVVHSLAGVQYGSGWVAGDTAIALGNRVGTSLTTRPDLAAANPVPGSVLPHTLSAAWFDGGDRWLLIATPGGDRQVQWLAQAGQRFRRGEPLSAIVGGPRWFVCPEGDRFGVPGGIGKEWFLFAEPGIEWSEDADLASFAIKRVDNVGGGLQAVELEDGTWRLGSDPRSGGTALAGGATDV